MGSVRSDKIMGLLGLACRAGKLALGSTAVDRMVHRGENPVVIVATDAGASLKSKADRWDPVRAVVDDAVTTEEMGLAFGRDKLAVVAVAESGFVKGIRKLMEQESGRESGQE